MKYLGHLQQKSTFLVGSGSSTSSTSSTSKDYHHLNLPPLGGGLVHGGGRHGDAAADPLGDAGGAIYSTGTETIDDHQGSAHQGWLVVWNMTSMTFHKNWECHFIPTDFHSMIFQRCRFFPPTSYVSN